MSTLERRVRYLKSDKQDLTQPDISMTAYGWYLQIPAGQETYPQKGESMGHDLSRPRFHIRRQAAGMHDYRPGEQRRFRQILLLGKAFCVFRDEITIRLLRLQPLFRAGISAVQRRVDRFMEHGFLEIVIAYAGLDVS